MQLETLYKRTKTGSIQQWTIEVHNYGTGALIVKQAGQLGGKLTMHEEDVKVGKNIGKKNETTPYEQALSQAQSDWKKKHDEGYKSLNELGITPDPDPKHEQRGLPRYFWTGSTTGSDLLEDILEVALPKFNTDASGNLKPMLAPTKPWSHGHKKNKYPMLAEVKYDGLRCTAVLTPTETKILSRSGKEYPIMYRIVNQLDAYYPKTDRPDIMILDGELYYHGLLLEEINEAVKAESENTHLIQLVCYDVPTMGNLEQVIRGRVLRSMIDSMNTPLITYSESFTVNSDDEVQQLHDDMANLGYEGLILKDPEGFYEPGQRSNFWKKVKMFDETEFMIVGHKLGIRGAQDLAFICQCNDGKDTFDAPMNGSVALKKRIVDSIDTYMGKDLTVKHFGYSKYNIPNLPKGKAIREPGS